MEKKIHSPEGVRDIFGRECDKKRYLENRIEKLFRSYGYQSVETPAFEFLNVFSEEVGTTRESSMFRFFDSEGHTLALRPDFTPAIARAVSMYFAEEDMPLRLCYHGSVFTNNPRLQGRLKERTEMGVEFLNDDSLEADAEILALVVSAMKRAGLPQFQVTIGHAGFFDALTEEAGLEPETADELRRLLSTENRFGAQELIDRLQLRSDLKKAFTAMPELFGDETMLAAAARLTDNRRAREAVQYLRDLGGLLELHGCSDYVTFDLGMVTEYRYYTGIVFQAYTYGSGDAIIRGGRYNRLISRFGKDAPAIGFTTQIDALLSALDRQKIELPVADIKTMILYPAALEPLAIRFAAAQREKKLDVACVRFEPGRVLDQYREYGLRNQFGGILYFRSESEAYAINLQNGSVEEFDPQECLPGSGTGGEEP